MFDFLRAEKKQSKHLITNEVIERAYKRRAKEIDSLRQYDRGEKEIHAPNFKDIVQGLRRSS